jgi:hypothetical protein
MNKGKQIFQCLNNNSAGRNEAFIKGIGHKQAKSGENQRKKGVGCAPKVGGFFLESCLSGFSHR